jgi:hypothetical protein
VAGEIGRRDRGDGGTWFNATAGQMPFPGPFRDAPYTDVSPDVGPGAGPVIDQPAPVTPRAGERRRAVGDVARTVARGALADRRQR